MRLFLTLFAMLGATILCHAEADRSIYIDSEGIMHWQDDNSEVALFGVNYYTPFSIDHYSIEQKGLNHEQAIREDVTHFARMNLGSIRLHCFERQFSDRDGNLIDNDHLQLLDYLIAECKKRGIYTVLTPIAWWGVWGGDSGKTTGFSDYFTMHEMTTDLTSRAAQRNFLTQFVNHVNRYTGLAYKDDPAVICFECINEPLYPAGTTEAQITEYINALAGAIKDTGCTKPVFYNCWGSHFEAAANSILDGVSCGDYPTGLASGGTLTNNYLPRVDDYSYLRDPRVMKMAKMIYEFDAADTHTAVMYPAMTRAFRTGGIQIANMFQYDLLATASGNPNWQTHYLNLVYTPTKAMSFAIANEIMHRVPLYKSYGRYPDNTRFEDFRLNYEQDVSEMVTDTDFLYANNTDTLPPAPEKLTRVWGVGSSPVVQYGGTGCYFLDRIDSGVWKLQVYPDAVIVSDPYEGGANEKTRCLWKAHEMTVQLPDLGADFKFIPCDAQRIPAPDSSQPGPVTEIAPGEYLLVAQNIQVPEIVPGVEFIAAPSSTLPLTACISADPQARVGKSFIVEATVPAISDTECMLYVCNENETGFTKYPMQNIKPYRYKAVVPGDALKPGLTRYFVSVKSDASTLYFPGNDEYSPESSALKPVAPFELLDIRPDMSLPEIVKSLPAEYDSTISIVPGRDAGKSAIRLEATGFGKDGCSAISIPPASLPADMSRYSAVKFIARGSDITHAVEISLVQEGRQGFGTNVSLGQSWGEFTIPLRDLRPMWETTESALKPEKIKDITMVFGAWIFGERSNMPHWFEVQSVQLIERAEVNTISVVKEHDPVTIFSPAFKNRTATGRQAFYSTVRGMDDNSTALRVSVTGFNPLTSDATSFASPLMGITERWQDELARAKYVNIKARCVESYTDRFELVLLEADGSPWGNMGVLLTPQWQEIKIPLSDFRFFSHWMGPKNRGFEGDKINPEKISSLNVCFGSWLFPGNEEKPHAIEIQEITLSAN